MDKTHSLSCCSVDSPIDLAAPRKDAGNPAAPLRSGPEGRNRTGPDAETREETEPDLSVTAGIVMWMALHGGC